MVIGNFHKMDNVAAVVQVRNIWTPWSKNLSWEAKNSLAAQDISGTLRHGSSQSGLQKPAICPLPAQ